MFYVSKCFVDSWMYSRKKYSDDAIIIEIKSDFKNEFMNKEFKMDDFDFDNMETFSYSKWYDTKNRGYLFIYLKKTGKKEVEEALKHLKQLSFVEECEKMPIIQILKKINNSIFFLMIG